MAKSGESGDWFNDEWLSAVVHNAQLAARIAKKGGVKGLALDTEQRGDSVFDYRRQSRSQTKSFDEYKGRVRQCGAQIMRGMSSAYPDITLMLTMSTSAVAFEMSYEPDLAMQESEYGLLPAFVDGLIEGARQGTRIVDGYRRAFHFTNDAQFVAAYRAAKDAADLSAIPEAYRKTIAVGFGVNLAWHSDKVLEDVLHYAQAICDQYVWVWHHHWDYKDPLSRMHRSRVFALLNSRLARDAEKPTPITDLSAHWGLKGPAFQAARLKSEGFTEHGVPKLFYVEGDSRPQTGTTLVRAGSVTFDFNQRSMVLDLGQVKHVDAIQLYASMNRPGNRRLDASNVELYCSDDNTSYRRIACTYTEPGRHMIELRDIGVAARYFKIHSTVKDATEHNFSEGTEYGGSGAFIKR